jgi:hypothetical protein
MAQGKNDSLELSRALDELGRLQDIDIIVLGSTLSVDIRAALGIGEDWLAFTFEADPEAVRAFKLNPSVRLPHIALPDPASPLRLSVTSAHPAEPIRLSDYFSAWRSAIRLALPRGRQFVPYVGQALRTAFPHDRETQHQLVDSLWEERWIADAAACGDLRLGLLVDSPEALARLTDEGEEGAQAFLEVESRLRVAKETARSLDEWLIAVYRLVPLLIYAARLLPRGSATEGISGLSRMIDEWLADAYGVVRDAALRGFVLRHRWPWSEHYLIGALEAAEFDVEEAQRQIRLDFESRIGYPRFWRDAALACLAELGHAPLPPSLPIPRELDAFNATRALSLLMTMDLGEAIGMFWAFSKLSRSERADVAAGRNLQEVELKITFRHLRRIAPEARIEGLPAEYLETPDPDR